MTRDKQIIEASHNYGKTLNEEAVFDYEDMKCAFKEGAMWANKHRDNVWHDESEEPQESMNILCLSKKGSINLVSNINEWLYNWLKNESNLDKWAYISDLLPKGGEE